MGRLSNQFTDKEDGFIAKITPSDSQRARIIEAKNKVRDYLREGITREIKAQTGVTVEPHFMSQGSFKYKTQNSPCRTPPQQIDHDLGCYLPLEIVTQTGKPSVASQKFFDVVDSLLIQLVEKENWTGTDTSKITCARAIVCKDIHIDVPLYCIPFNEFKTIHETMKKSLVYNAMESMKITKKSWNDYELNKVLLAQRDDDWRPSDTRKLNNYFEKLFKTKGEQLRRICRYLKAWRDYHWDKGGPSSLYLMLLADAIYDAETKGDDVALLEILLEMHERLSDSSYKVNNPTDKNEEIKIAPEDRKHLMDISLSFSRDLQNAINTGTRGIEEVCTFIAKNHLGNRFPTTICKSDEAENYRQKVLSTAIKIEPERVPNSRGRAG